MYYCFFFVFYRQQFSSRVIYIQSVFYVNNLTKYNTRPSKFFADRLCRHCPDICLSELFYQIYCSLREKWSTLEKITFWYQRQAIFQNVQCWDWDNAMFFFTRKSYLTDDDSRWNDLIVSFGEHNIHVKLITIAVLTKSFDQTSGTDAIIRRYVIFILRDEFTRSRKTKSIEIQFSHFTLHTFFFAETSTMNIFFWSKPWKGLAHLRMKKKCSANRNEYFAMFRVRKQRNQFMVC